MPAWSQIVPEAGTVQCFLAGTGGMFTDPGGPGGDPVNEGAPGNYPNCNCVTTTTICSVDGTPLSVTFENFAVFASFDWLVILDTDNPGDELYPASILSDPANTALQLFNNSDGVGDGGAENYGPGAEEGVSTLGELPTTTFTSTNASGCLTFVFRASGVVDDPGWDALISTAGGTPHPGDDLDCDANVSCFPPANLDVAELNAESVLLTWQPVDTSTTGYFVVYGPAGFPAGTGDTLAPGDTTSVFIDGLVENAFYDFYVIADCGSDGLSAPAGPLTVQTPFINPPATCTYTLELTDDGGNGWSGNTVAVTVNGVTTTYTLDGINDDGTQAVFPITVLDGWPIVVTYNYVTFNSGTITLYDADGFVLAEAITSFSLSEVYNDLASCPNCPAPNPFAVEITDITDTTALANWPTNSAHLYYELEWGPAGFPQGVGLTDTTTLPPYLLEGLNPGVEYDLYIEAVCGQDSVSNTVGPYTFTTTYTPPGATGDTCTYTLELFDSFGDGWNGAVLTITINGQSTDYTFSTGNEATFQFTALQNVPFFVSYSPGSFENEVSYNILDPDGNIVFSDGPYPQTGEVTSIVACPSCAPPLNASVYDVNATNAILMWEPSDETVPHVIEWGPLGFTLGTGQSAQTDPGTTMLTLTGLTEHTWYDVYIYAACDSAEHSLQVGPLSFQTLWLNDVGVAGLLRPNPDTACNLGVETIGLLLANYGQAPQSLFPFKYSVNGVPAGIPIPTDGLFTGVLGNDSLIYVEFDTKWDFSEPGTYHVEVWTELDNDSDRTNDTFAIDIVTAYYLPLMEDFESLEFPAEWTHSEFGNIVYAPNLHNNPTAVISDNLYSGDQSFEVTTYRVGPINDGDSLTFDYRYVNWSAGTVATELTSGDSLMVLFSTDCGDSWDTVFTLVGTDHVPTTDFTTIGIDLSPWAGMAINIRFVGIWGAGDYWLDLDNINIPGCPPTLGLTAKVTPAEGSSTGDGEIHLNDPLFGTGPYTFEWSNGATGTTLVGLDPGFYTVTVSDALGCMQIEEYEVPALVGAREQVLVEHVVLSPNPTDGQALMRFRLSTASDVQIDIFSMEGKLMWQRQFDHVVEQDVPLDVHDWPAGMYIVRLQSGKLPHFEKLVIVR